jgi:DNA-binding LacI/PurR family transcriptional regulator
LVFSGAPGVNAETEARIRAAAKEIGYRPNFAAQSLRADSSKYIGVVFHTDESSTQALLPALYTEAAKNGFDILLSAISPLRSEAEAIDDILGHRCDGIIIIGSHSSTTRLQKLAREIPLVSIGRRLEKVRAGSVTSKGEQGVFDATEYLIGLGHKKIAYVFGKEMLDGDFRLEGYKSAMMKYKLPTNVVTITGDFAERGGAVAAEQFLNKDLPTAIICNNDQSAFGLTHRLLMAGVSIPHDVSVVGYDDVIAGYPFLDFTTVRQDHDELAEASVADIVARIRGEKYISETFLLSSKLVVRSSTAAPRVP